MKSILIAFCLFGILGCEQHSPESDKSAIISPASNGWFASFTLEQAQGMSPEDAKAILVARAAIEAKEEMPTPMEFAVSRRNGEIDVQVTFFGRAGTKRAYLGGGFCTVSMDAAWRVIRIAPGY